MMTITADGRDASDIRRPVITVVGLGSVTLTLAFLALRSRIR